MDEALLVKLKKDKSFAILVKPNSSDTRITGFDESSGSLKVDIAAPPNDNKANIEVIKFFSRLLKAQVRISKGLKSKEKILKIL